MAILDSGDDRTVAAYDCSARKLVMVTTNPAAGHWITYDFSPFKAVSGPAARWTTDTRPGGGKYSRQDIPLSSKRLHAWLAPSSVQTFELSVH